MLTSTVAFLNCAQLEKLQGISYTDKVSDLAKTILTACGLNPPLAVALCEVHSKAAVDDLAADIYGEFPHETRFSAPIGGGVPGIAMIFASEWLQHDKTHTDRLYRSDKERPRWAVFQMRKVATPRTLSTGAIFFAVVHLKASTGEVRTESVDRWNSLEEIARLYRRPCPCCTPTSTSFSSLMTANDHVVLLGDFNCEVGSDVFQKGATAGLYITRQKAAATKRENRAARLYNPSYELFPFPLDHRTGRPSGSSWPNAGTPAWYGSLVQDKMGNPYLAEHLQPLIDMIMFSPSLVGTSWARYRDGTVKLTRPVGTCTEHCAISVVIDFD